MSVSSIVAASAAVLGAAYWIFSVVTSLRVVRSVRVLEKLSPPEPARWPRLSLVIPARDEADQLEAALRSRLREDYPDLELVVVNDRSTDETGAILDRLAAEDARIVPIHLTELPPGWLGKVHAMHRGVERCSGEWILLTDADVHLEPGTLRKVIAYAESRGLGHLGALPTVRKVSFLLDAVIAFCVRLIFGSFRPWEVEDPDSSAAAGAGAFNLMRRDAYLRTPGFAWLKMEIADDAGLAQMLKEHGARTAFLNGRRLIHLQFYPSIRAMARNLEKSGGIGTLRPAVMMVAGLVLLVAELSPFVALLLWPLQPPSWALALALGTCAVALANSAAMNRWMGQPALPALLVPVGSAIACVIAMRAAVLAQLRGGVFWRGTFHPLEQLHAGSRFRMRGPAIHRAPAGAGTREQPRAAT